MIQKRSRKLSKNDVLETAKAEAEVENFVSCDEEGSIDAVEKAYLEGKRHYEESKKRYNYPDQKEYDPQAAKN